MIKKLIPAKLKQKLFPYYFLLRKSIGDKLITSREYNAKKIVSATPPKPRVVNLNANDICNSKCTMCNIWQQKQGFEVSPEQLKVVLQNELFQEVSHIGITGGEPTLREDLSKLYEAAIEAIPSLHGLSIITNAIRENDVRERIDQVIEVCRKHQKSFSMMVSLDGYGEMHDKVRGRNGNFETAINIIAYFQQKKISVATGTTISKVNVWEVDDLLEYMKENGIYGRFRVAEFINRLYNNDRKDVIRHFDEDETYHLILFFYKLIFTFEKDPTYQSTYYSIINILAGGKRTIGCPYHSHGVVLNSRAEIAYCAPKSPIIGSAMEEDANALFLSNLDKRKTIIDTHCDSCIHDYHAGYTPAERRRQIMESFYRNVISLNNMSLIPFQSLVRKKRNGQFQVFITGWYGTETVGDKAILAGIVHEIQQQSDVTPTFVVTSLFPHITERTLIELGIEATVVAVYSQDFIAYCKGSDWVVMGGGPLMDLEELALPLHAFLLGKAVGAKNIVYGCGLGPLNDARYIKAVQKILLLAQEIKLRDRKSVELAKKWLNGKNTPVSLSGDPAKLFLLNRKSSIQARKGKRNVMSCFLREWTHEYSKDLNWEEFKEAKLHFEAGIAEYIKSKALELGVEEIVLDHMHNFVVGNDDRDFSRYFIKKYLSDFPIPITYNRYLSTVDSIIDRMTSSTFNICMRFHSVVFAHTLDTSFAAVDYTKGGKILNYLRDNGQEDKLLTVESLSVLQQS